MPREFFPLLLVQPGVSKCSLSTIDRNMEIRLLMFGQDANDCLVEFKHLSCRYGNGHGVQKRKVGWTIIVP